MKYDLFISDYDGTLGIAPKNDIDPETLSAINKYIEKGGIFAVCSGRETTSITRILREQNLKGIVVSFQGARASDIETGELIFNGGLPVERAIEVVSLLKDEPIIPLVYLDDGFYFDERNEYVERYERAIRLKGEVRSVKEVLESRKGSVCKVVWLGEDELVNELAKKLNEKYNGVGVKFNSGAKNLLEAINPECGKGQAVKFLAKYYNIPLSKVITVGDSTNDIDLVKGEWHGVCVGDGREELKALAKEITVPYEEKPVKVLLEKYCL